MPAPRRSRRLAKAGRGAGYTRPRSVRRRGPVVTAIPAPLRGRFQINYPDMEKKFLDTSIDDAVVATAMTATNLAVVPVGDNSSERVGRKINIRNVYCKGTIVIPATANSANTSDSVTLMLLADTQTNKTAFAGTDLLVADSWKSYRNLNFQERFKVLYHRQISLGTGGGSNSGAVSFGEVRRQFKLGKKLNMDVTYDNTVAETGAVTTQSINSLWWCVWSESGIASIVGNARIRYTDK